MSENFYRSLFVASNIIIAPFWLLMILAPKWEVTRKVIGSRWIVFPIALCYAAPIAPFLATDLPTLAKPNYDAIHDLFGLPRGTALAWAHIVAFDLFVARWIYLDSRSRDLNPWMMAPIMVLSLLAGPFGYCLYNLLITFIGGKYRRQEPLDI